MTETTLRAFAIDCTLSPSPAESSTELLTTQVLSELESHGAQTTMLRAVDFDIEPGVEIKMSDDDAWPEIRKQILQADIFIIATPTWMGHMSSIAQRVLERLDAELSETDDQGRLLTQGKVAVTLVVGNEDGAHKIVADTFQALNDVGFTIPAIGSVYWNSEAMTQTDYKDLDETPEAVSSTINKLATHSVHLAQLLKTSQYPPTQ